MSVAAARQHAFQVLEAAEAAETDAFFVEFLQQRLGLEFEKAVQCLGDFRRFRQARDPDTRAS